MGSNGWYDKYVLSGSREPVWGCHCGYNGNWANRIRCKSCGTWAPTTIQDKAKEEDRRAMSNKKGWQWNGSNKASGDGWQVMGKKGRKKYCTDSDALDSELQTQIYNLVNQFKAGNRDVGEGGAQQQQQQPAAEAVEPVVTSASIQTLQVLYDQSFKNLGEFDENTVRLKQRLAEAKQKRDESKPVSSRIKRAEMHVASCKKFMDEAQLHVDSTVELLEYAKSKLNQSKEAYEKAEADLQRALTQAQGSVDIEGIRGISKFVPILEQGVEGADCEAKALLHALMAFTSKMEKRNNEDNIGPAADEHMQDDGPSVIPAMEHILKQAAEQRQQAAAETSQQSKAADRQGHDHGQAQKCTKEPANIPARGRKATGADGPADGHVHGIHPDDDEVAVPESRSRSRSRAPSI